MAQANDTATFNINLQGNAADAATTAASSMQQLRDRIADGQGALKEMSANLRNLRGSTDEVKAAKDQLKAKLDAERAAVSTATLQLLKHGTAASKTGKDAKALGEEKSKAAAKTKAFGAAISTAGGPLASLRDKFSTLKGVVGEGGAGGAMSLFTLGMAASVAAVAALVAGIAAGAIALGKFIIRGADAARSAGLLREAAMGGNAQWGKNFGEQVDALAMKVPTAKAEIDKLGRSLAMSHIGGQTWVDTLNAVTQASAAVGDEAGGKIKEFVTRAREFGRFRLNPREMVGTGVEFKDVAEALATSMHVGVKEAQAALVEGRVNLADGAAAMRGAVEKKFSKINLRQMISLDNLSTKFGETLDSLTKDIDLEPLLNGLKELADIFSVSTESGQALKQMVQVFGKDMIGAFSSGTPVAKKYIYGLIIGAQEVVIAYLRVRNGLRDTFANSDFLKNVDIAGAATRGIKRALITLGVAIGVVVAAGVALVVAVDAIEKVLTNLPDQFLNLADSITHADWIGIGKSVIDGLVNGLKGGANRLKETVLGLGASVKQSFKDALGIHSPSKVFAEFGENTTAGYAKGVERSSGDAQSAVDAMVAAPASSGTKAAAAGGLTINVGGITIQANGGNAQEIAAAVTSSSFLEQLTKAIVDAVHAGGVPVPA